MAGIREICIFRNKLCGYCNYNWDYPIARDEMLNNLQKLYYFEINVCPNCNCISRDITQVGEEEKNFQKDKEYKAIVSNRNIPFSYAYKKESYEYELYGYICKSEGKVSEYAKSYVMAYFVEETQREKFINGLIYDEEKDKSLINQSFEKQKRFLNNAYKALKSVIGDTIDQDEINLALLLAYVCKLAGNKDESMFYLNEIATKKLSSVQVNTIKEIVKAVN